jgi:hypothetical protein
LHTTSPNNLQHHDISEKCWIEIYFGNQLRRDAYWIEALGKICQCGGALFFSQFSDVASSSSQHPKQNVASIDQKFGENWKL